MKVLIKFFTISILLLTAVSQANSVYKYIEITDDKAYFVKYIKTKAVYLQKIKDGSISFSLKNNNPNTEFFCGEIGCFFVNSGKKSLKDSGILEINDEGKIISLPYEITFNKKNNAEIYKILIREKKERLLKQSSKQNGIDISENMKYKSIQKRALSCEISATADILSYLIGMEVKEGNLLPHLEKSQYNSLPKNKNGKIYWGNPQEGFVGYIDKLPNGDIARQRKMTGYGVLEKPIEKIINKYGFRTKIISQYNYLPSFSKNEHLSLILKEIKKGNMVQLWGDICTNPEHYNGQENPCTYQGKPSWNYERKISWYYTDESGIEKKYTGLNGEHAFYLLGYKGDISKPSHIIVWDTYTGKHTYPTSEWMRKWKKMQYRSIIAYAN